VCVLADDDDPDLGMRLTQALGRLDALVRAARRHAYVGDDDVRALRVDGSEKRREVIAGCDDCKLWPRLEQATDPLADEIVVLGEHEPDRHRRSIRR